ncbi:MAG: tRNA-dihydrouridine synthase family protein [Victivallales bacterium]|nr:tRNA-dihydrouridine synthase family protein [Victivallales bacterium]
MPHPWLEPLSFRDGRALPCRILPGPMEGVTEGSFVQVLGAAHLIRCWFTPFIRISNGVPRRSRLRPHIQPYLDTGVPVIAQIMGTRTELLAEAAARLHELGATCVDLNCACPSPEVLSSRSGGFLLQNPQWIHDTIAAMKRACGPRAVSVKIRVGFASPDELPAITEAIRNARPDLVTCHFRTVREMYSPVSNGLARLSRLRELLPDLPLFGSGDLFTIQDALQMHQICHVDGIAPARGLMRNPALLREIEAAIGGEPFQASLDESAKLAFLHEIGRVSGKSPTHQGFVLRLAKAMFGPDSPQFHALLDALKQPTPPPPGTTCAPTNPPISVTP